MRIKTELFEISICKKCEHVHERARMKVAGKDEYIETYLPCSKCGCSIMGL